MHRAAIADKVWNRVVGGASKWQCDVFGPEGKGNSDYAFAWMLLLNLAKKDRQRGKEKRALSYLNLSTCLGVTRSKLNLKPDHSAVVTGFMVCGFTMSFYKTLSEATFSTLQGQHPFHSCRVKACIPFGGL